jgi:4-amino-4-deoxy-L-arabinose transferase-like glycosyltransferase
MLHECPNCRERITYFRVFRTAAWRTFRCKACGSVLGISLPRRIIAIAIWLAVFLFVMEFLGFYTWGRLYTYSFMAVSLMAVMYVGDRVVLVDRRAFTCKRCGYDLQGLPEPRCPECGTVFDPAERERILARFHAPPPSPRYWWVGVSVAVLVLLGVVGGLVAWRRGAQLPPRAWWIPLLIVILALVAIAGAMVARRQASRSASPSGPAIASNPTCPGARTPDLPNA